MSNITPFQFPPIEQHGDASSPAAPSYQPPASAPLPKKFTQKDLDAAEKKGYERGAREAHEKGVAEGKQERFALDQQLLQVITEATQKVAAFNQDYAALVEQKTADTLKLGLAIAKKVAEPALKEDPQSIIEDAVARCMTHLFSEKKVVLTVHESLAQKAQEICSAKAKEHGLETEIQVRGIADIAEADCRIEWENGGALVDSAALWEQIEKVLEGLGKS